MSRETLSKDTKDIVHALLGEDKETPLVVLGHRYAPSSFVFGTN